MFRPRHPAQQDVHVETVVDMPLHSISPTTSVEALHVKRRAAIGQVAVDVAFWGGS